MSFEAYIRNIETKTGKTETQLTSLAKKKGLFKPGVKATQITDWLKQDFDLGHGHAMAMVALFKSKSLFPDVKKAKTAAKKSTVATKSKNTKPLVAEKKKGAIKADPSPATDSAAVTKAIEQMKHPLVEVVKALRKIILAADKQIGELIAWNAPSFIYTGPIKAFSPKEYKRHIVVFNLYKQDCIRLVFMHCNSLENQFGFLEGNYKDGRRIATFYSLEEVKANEKLLKQLLKTWIGRVEK